jgi:hypothetical protein
MKLPDFTLDSALNELRRRMGADKLGNFTTEYRPDALTMEELERLAQEGIEVSFEEITRLKDGTLGYKNSRVLVHIRDVATYGGQFELPKFHVAYCGTLEKMKEANRFERYVVANREDGKFQINKIDNARKRSSSWEQLNVCQNCLNALRFDDFSYSLPRRTRKEIVNNFAIARFFERYPKSLHLRRPQHDYTTAPINEYSPGFSETATRYKTDKNWKCEKCDLTFSDPSERQFLHVHHINAQKYDDDPKNHRALCFGCHANEFQHTHMKNTDQYKEFLGRHGQRWSAALAKNRR